MADKQHLYMHIAIIYDEDRDYYFLAANYGTPKEIVFPGEFISKDSAMEYLIQCARDSNGAVIESRTFEDNVTNNEKRV